MDEYDVVVIGAGPSGCAFAHRLCRETSLRVCLVEAGPDYGPASSGRWPSELLDPRRLPKTHDWGYVEREVPEPRAKVIGGCTAHNQCAAMWGAPTDYDGWATATGDPRWRYASLRPLLDSIEDCISDDGPFRGHGGLVRTRPHPEDALASWQRAFLDAAAATGFERLADLSDPEPVEGVAAFHANIDEGRRLNAAFAFVDPVRGTDRLVIRHGTTADRLVPAEGHVRTLRCATADGTEEISAGHFVLTAGVYGNVGILLRSGIGAANHLSSMDIPVAIALPGVGANLHDHYGLVVRLEPTDAGVGALQQDLATGRFHQSQVCLRAADGDLHVFPYQSPAEDGSWTFQICAFLLRPRSRGRVRLRAPTVDAPLDIDFAFLSDPHDHDGRTLRETAWPLLARLAQTPPLSTLATLHERASPEDLADIVSGYSHAVGTCRIGRAGDPAAVADSAGLVRGLSNVTVADASLMPTIPAANTALTCMLIGWRQADAFTS